MKLDILAFGVHPDDVELGCSGTLLKHIHLGYKVGIVDLTQGELGTRGDVPARQQEALDAARLMGVENRKNLGLPDGFLENNHRSQIKVIEVIRQLKPDIVIANAIADRHPDHGRSAQLVSDACFLSGLMKIETELDGQAQEAWRPKEIYHYIQDRYISPNLVIDISDFMDTKMKAIKAYKSQFYNPDSSEPETYISSSQFLDNVVSRAQELGRSLGFKYAEGFTTERFIGIESLMDIS